MAVDLEQELKRTTELRGFRFGLHDFVAQIKGRRRAQKAQRRDRGQYSVARINGLEAWRAAFRPDVPSIDRVVELK